MSMPFVTMAPKPHSKEGKCAMFLLLHCPRSAAEMPMDLIYFRQTEKKTSMVSPNGSPRSEGVTAGLDAKTKSSLFPEAGGSGYK